MPQEARPVQDPQSCLHVLFANHIELASPPLHDLSTLSACQCHWYIGDASESSDVFEFSEAPQTVAINFAAFLVTDSCGDADLRFTIANADGEHLAVKFGTLSDMASGPQFEEREFELACVAGVLAKVIVHCAVQDRWTAGDPPPRNSGECVFVGREDPQVKHVLDHIYGSRTSEAEEEEDEDEDEDESEAEDEEELKTCICGNRDAMDVKFCGECGRRYPGTAQETTVEEIKVVKETIVEEDKDGHHKIEHIIQEKTIHEESEQNASSRCETTVISEKTIHEESTKNSSKKIGWAAKLSDEEEGIAGAYDDETEEAQDEEEGWWEEGGEEEPLEGDECVEPTDDEIDMKRVASRRRSSVKNLGDMGKRASIIAARRGSRASLKRGSVVSRKTVPRASVVAPVPRPSSVSVATKRSTQVNDITTKRHSQVGRRSSIARRRISTTSAVTQQESLRSHETSSSDKRRASTASRKSSLKSTGNNSQSHKSGEKQRASVTSVASSEEWDPYARERTMTVVQDPNVRQRTMTIIQDPNARPRTTIVVEDPARRSSSREQVVDERRRSRERPSKHKEQSSALEQDSFGRRDSQKCRDWLNHTLGGDLHAVPEAKEDESRIAKSRHRGRTIDPLQLQEEYDHGSSSGSSSSPEGDRARSGKNEADRARKDMSLVEPLLLTAGLKEIKQRTMRLRSKMQMVKAWEAISEAAKSEDEFDEEQACPESRARMSWEVHPKRGRWFRVEAKTVTARRRPHIDSAVAQHLLLDDVFKAISSCRGDDGFSYLEIVHRRGWVLNDARVRPVKIVEEAEPLQSPSVASFADTCFNADAQIAQRDKGIRVKVPNTVDDDCKVNVSSEAPPSIIGHQTLVQPHSDTSLHHSPPHHHQIQHHHDSNHNQNSHAHHHRHEHQHRNLNHEHQQEHAHHQGTNRNQSSHAHHQHQHHHLSINHTHQQELEYHHDSNCSQDSHAHPHQQHHKPLQEQHNKHHQTQKHSNHQGQHHHPTHNKQYQNSQHQHHQNQQHQLHQEQHQHGQNQHQQVQQPNAHQQHSRHCSSKKVEVHRQHSHQRTVVHQPLVASAQNAEPIRTIQLDTHLQPFDNVSQRQYISLGHSAHTSAATSPRGEHVELPSFTRGYDNAIVLEPTRMQAPENASSREYFSPLNSVRSLHDGVAVRRIVPACDSTITLEHVRVQPPENATSREYFSPLNSARSLHDGGRVAVRDTMSLSQSHHQHMSNSQAASPNSTPAGMHFSPLGQLVKASPSESFFGVSSCPTSGPSTPRGGTPLGQGFAQTFPARQHVRSDYDSWLGNQARTMHGPPGSWNGLSDNDFLKSSGNPHINGSQARSAHMPPGSWKGLVETDLSSSSGTRSPHISTSFLAALQGQTSALAPRRSQGQTSAPAPRRAPIACGNVQHHRPDVVPNASLMHKNWQPAGSSIEVKPHTGHRSETKADMPSLLSSQISTSHADKAGYLRASMLQGRPRVEPPQPSASMPVNSMPGFSRAQALLAEIERSIREHPPCGVQDLCLDDGDMFSLGA